MNTADAAILCQRAFVRESIHLSSPSLFSDLTSQTGKLFMSLYQGFIPYTYNDRVWSKTIYHIFWINEAFIT